jgi:glycosyltransferase involved in cell wall biosynthesis
MANGRKRVLVLTSTFPRWREDVEPGFVLSLCRGLTRYCDIHVVAPHFHGAAEEDVLDEVSVTRFHYWISRWQTLAFEGGIANRLKRDPWKLLMLPFFVAAQALATRRLLRRRTFDVIHAHWILPQGLVALLVIWGTRKNRPRLLCTAHGGDWYSGRGRWMTAIRRGILARMDGVTVVGTRMRESMEAAGVYSEKISVIPMGTDLHGLFTPDDAVDRDPDTVLFAGRLVEKKGVKYLIDAFAAVRSSRPEARLMIAGWGPEESALRDHVERTGLTGCVGFLGAVPHPELACWYRRATLAVFPFVTARSGDEEGLGLVIVEAMGCECPVIVSELPAAQDLVNHESTGLLVRPRDSGGLAAAILRLLEDRGLAAQLGRTGRERVVERFDWASVVHRYALWLGAIEPPRGGGGRSINTLVPE